MGCFAIAGEAPDYWRRRIVAYLPDIYKEFTQHYPDISRMYEELADKCHESGPLDERVRRLVKLGIAVGLCSEGAVRSHTRRALEANIPVEEIEHVVLLSLTTAGYPTMTAAYKWAREVIDAARDKRPV
jgi:4-carboxymuconolactone decarboxylase